MHGPATSSNLGRSWRSAGRRAGQSRFDAAILHTQARSALTGLGWKPAIAHAAVDGAAAALGLEVTLEQLIVESLRRCPVSKT
jgi:Holliday junction resolvasome RuvABC DNA-binding subunit